MPSDALAVLVDLGAVGELLFRNVIELFEQRQVAIGIVVALDPGVTVPVPGAAEVPAQLQDPQIGDSRALQVRGRDQTRKAPAHDGDVEIFRDRIPDHAR